MGAEIQLTNEGPCQDRNPPLKVHKPPSERAAEPFPWEHIVELPAQACAKVRISGRKTVLRVQPLGRRRPPCTEVHVRRCTGFLWSQKFHNFSQRSIFRVLFYFLKILFIYLLERGEGKGERGRETSMCGCLSHTPNWGPGLQPRHVP